MTKLYKKTDLHTFNGYLLNEDNEIVKVPTKIIEQYIAIDVALQKAQFMAEQPKYQKAPSLDGFEPAHIEDCAVKAKQPETPELDEMVKHSMALLKDLEAVEQSKNYNEFVEDYKDLFNWIDKDYVIGDDDAPIMQWDSPLFGDPLQWKSAQMFLDFIFDMDPGDAIA